MDWSTVAFFGIAVVVLAILCWAGVAVYAIRKQREMAEGMDKNFDERREEMRRRFGR